MHLISYCFHTEIEPPLVIGPQQPVLINGAVVRPYNFVSGWLTPTAFGGCALHETRYVISKDRQNTWLNWEFIYLISNKGESNGNLPLRICPGCSVPGPYR